MKRHQNPYRIKDEKNWFEVCENSSHPELKDSRRVYHFRGYTFLNATQVEKYFRNEGLNPREYTYIPRSALDEQTAKNVIHIFICERVPKEEQHQARGYNELFG